MCELGVLKIFSFARSSKARSGEFCFLLTSHSENGRDGGWPGRIVIPGDKSPCIEECVPVACKRLTCWILPLGVPRQLDAKEPLDVRRLRVCHKAGPKTSAPTLPRQTAEAWPHNLAVAILAPSAWALNFAH